jgi:hypothetical protein
MAGTEVNMGCEKTLLSLGFALGLTLQPAAIRHAQGVYLYLYSAYVDKSLY